jgi:hypothetical protein
MAEGVTVNNVTDADNRPMHLWNLPTRRWDYGHHGRSCPNLHASRSTYSRHTLALPDILRLKSPALQTLLGLGGLPLRSRIRERNLCGVAIRAVGS